MTTTTADLEYVDRTTQTEDTLYVEPDGTVWMTPDGIGRIYLFNDAEQTDPMDEDEAIEETGITCVFTVAHTCDRDRCAMADGATRCSG